MAWPVASSDTIASESFGLMVAFPVFRSVRAPRARPVSLPAWRAPCSCFPAVPSARRRSVRAAGGSRRAAPARRSSRRRSRPAARSTRGPSGSARCRRCPGAHRSPAAPNISVICSRSCRSKSAYEGGQQLGPADAALDGRIDAGIQERDVEGQDDRAVGRQGRRVRVEDRVPSHAHVPAEAGEPACHADAERVDVAPVADRDVGGQHRSVAELRVGLLRGTAAGPRRSCGSPSRPIRGSRPSPSPCGAFRCAHT